MDIYYYAAFNRESRSFRVETTVCDESVMTGDDILFDSPEACMAYWKNQGIEVE